MEFINRNLALLAKLHPELAHKLGLEHRQNPSDFLHDENDFKIGQERFYSMDGKKACQLQVQQFMQHPTHFSLTYRNETSWSHQRSMGNLQLLANENKYVNNKKPYITSLVLLGTGLGFQIDELSKYFEFRHIIIVEPSDSMLLGFLHTCDLEKLTDKCNKNGGQVSIIQPENLTSFQSMLMTAAAQIGYNLFSELTLYRHYNTELFDVIFEQFKAIRLQCISSWGFFEDELIGLQNSISNGQRHPFVLDKAKPESLLNTIAIVGNGPSLSQNIEHLKSTKNQLVIMSCGSTLATLLRHDIIPNIHVEMERSEFTASVQKKWVADPRLNETILVALNTVPTEITSAFEKTILFCKANDIGSQFLKQQNSDLTTLYHSNPTATNLGAAAAINLGYKQLILLGCDYGFKDENKHHAQGSGYYDEQSALAKCIVRSELTVEDNRGKPIKTTRIFNQAKLSLEALLRAHPNIQCINTSDGVKIENTQFRPLQDIALENLSKKSPLWDSLKDKRATLHSDSPCLKRVLNHLLDMTQDVQEQFEAASIQHVENGLVALNKYCEQKRCKEPGYILLVGMFRYLSVCISGHLSRIHPDRKRGYCSKAVNEVTSLLNGCMTTLNQLKKEIL